MRKYFDHTFFRFFFGFLAILVVSFALLFFVEHWTNKANPDDASTYVDAHVSDPSSN
jgi:Trk-type K+ transport system membrane component